jgi:hypothetical protein
LINPLENCLLLLGLPAILVLAGYGLVARLEDLVPAERLAAAVLGGLCLLIWEVSVVACFVPLSGFWAWLCLWPLGWTLLRPGVRRSLGGDLSALLRRRRGIIGSAVLLVFFLLLLWPLLTTAGLVYYDGTSNHDGFLWICDAEHLKRHTYWQMPAVTATQPYAFTARAIVGWRPPWGRMGAEGLLALASSIVGLAPVKLYVSATAALYFPWVAAVYLLVRTFFVERLTTAGFVALLGLQSVFVFFHANANLPNLMGAITAGLVVVATERSLHAGRRHWGWLGLLALSVHALLCSYPDMWPFVALPAGLLWLRGAFTLPRIAGWRPVLLTLAGLVGGTLLNLASTVRAWNGFIGAVADATRNLRGNMFAALTGTEFVPALLTLAAPASKRLGSIVGAVLTVVLAIAILAALRRARDRWGVLLIFAGGLLLAGYTLCVEFDYGWQKTVQFAGPMVAAVMPVVVVDHLARRGRLGPRAWLARGALAAVLGFGGYATVRNCLEWHKWSRRKFVNDDWFDLREYVRTHWRGQPVLVDAASFAEHFFHGMWATYFLADTPIYFSARGEQNGGYLHEAVANEGAVPVPPDAAVLVSRDWADGLDANSERLFVSETVALLRRSNRVTAVTGFVPTSGQPKYAEANATLTLVPHSAARLSLTLAAAPETTVQAGTIRWHARSLVAGRETAAIELATPPPWHLVLPLVPGEPNRIELVASGAPPADKLPPFVVEEARLAPAQP